jgi:hypothetical protein
MRNTGSSKVVSKRQEDRKQVWKKLFLRRQIRKERSCGLRAFIEEKEHSVCESTVEEEWHGSEPRIDYFDFSFLQ